MQMVEHYLDVTGPGGKAGGARPEPIGRVLRFVPSVFRYSVSMAFRSTSTRRGRPPTWFENACDIHFVDMAAGPDDATRLVFRAPRLGEAARDIYAQKSLFQDVYPDPEDTGFDLLGDVLRDVADEAQDSWRFDRALLNRLGRFGSLAEKEGIDAVSFLGRRLSADRPAKLSPEVSRRAVSLSRAAPGQCRARVTGKLDMIRDSDNAFELLVKDTARVHGAWLGKDMERLQELFGEEVVVEGMAAFRVSGNLLRLDGEAIWRATKNDEFFRKLPLPTEKRPERGAFFRPQTTGKGADALFDRWPGDETEEQILTALKDLG